MRPTNDTNHATLKKGRGRPRRFNDLEAVYSAIERLLEEHALVGVGGRYPTCRQFRAVGAEGLHRAVSRYGGSHREAAARLGLKLHHRAGRGATSRAVSL